ncbi:HEAT repeat protein [Rhodopseudomonas rhenobacensis]|uniref:HEAT repeat protein n=1 Tax=Rhodopseudomonas rhenobacensis TaxID=87461 RepID=A0A7W8DXW6_9BRAD|nr:HEAT repeat domain-containing protein [Rhodopseudomonas rhenobacensis]MBB5046190.1 HEAT repeat protein [Rhodopseudomonas rhenobacensis]
MPLIRRDDNKTAAPREPVADAAALTAALGDPDPDRRWRAARSLGSDAGAVPALAAALAAEQLPQVREAIMTALLRIGDAGAVAALLPSLRAQDAALRASAIEALQAMPEATLPFMTALFADADSDVRILATELVRNMPAETATPLLCDLLAHEPHPNVCAAAIDVLAEVGTPAAIPALQACASRFAEVSFLRFVVAVAIDQISGAEH